MKDENAFNAYLSHQLKRLRPQIWVIKNADRFQVGMADFQMVAGGHSVFFETKYMRKAPGKKTQGVLKHPFSGAQITFLRNMYRAGASAFGVVGLGYANKIRIICAKDIPLSGNWSATDWWAMNEQAMAEVDMGDTDELARIMTGLEGPAAEGGAA